MLPTKLPFNSISAPDGVEETSKVACDASEGCTATGANAFEALMCGVLGEVARTLTMPTVRS
jgi:hypothetical protein